MTGSCELSIASALSSCAFGVIGTGGRGLSGAVADGISGMTGSEEGSGCAAQDVASTEKAHNACHEKITVKALPIA